MKRTNPDTPHLPPSRKPPADPSGTRLRAMCLHALLTLQLVLCVTGAQAQCTGERGTATLSRSIMDLPPWKIMKWKVVTRFQSPLFANWSAPLGDLNRDGCDEVAIATFLDTIFVYYGGDPYSDEPRFTLYGGGSGMGVGDFNGDGRKDLVAASDIGHQSITGEDYRGRIRIWFNRQDTLLPTPDIEIVGDDPWGTLGETTCYPRPGVTVLDFNGDGYDDVAAAANDTISGPNIDIGYSYKVLLFFGGPAMDAQADAIFRCRPDTGTINDYGKGIFGGDINGDGYDDLLIVGYRKPRGERGYQYYELHLGNPGGAVRPPERIVWETDAWYPLRQTLALIDVNTDGCADLFDGRQWQGRVDAVFHRSSPTLPEKFLPNDAIPNFDPSALDRCDAVHPVGDINGDGSADFVLAWYRDYMPDGYDYYFYPAGSLYRNALGYFGANWDEQHVGPGVFPAGDVNGDGFDDMLILGYSTNFQTEILCRFQIYTGRKELATTVDGSHSAPWKLSLEVYPQPGSPQAREINLRFNAPTSEELTIRIFDILGRRITQTTQSCVKGANALRIPVETSLRPGMYFVRVESGRKNAVVPLVIQ